MDDGAVYYATDTNKFYVGFGQAKFEVGAGGGGSGASVVSRGHVNGVTTTQTLISAYAVGAADADFRVSGYVDMVTVSLASAKMTITFTDEDGTAETLDGVVFNSVAYNSRGPYTFRAKASTTITVTVTVLTGTPTYNASAILEKF
jgi:hypothetical protein